MTTPMRVFMPWARALPPFRDRKPGESMRDYTRLMCEFKQKAAKAQQEEYQAQQAQAYLDARRPK